VSVDPDGENAIVVAPGANDHLHLDNKHAERIGEADVVLAQLEIPLDVVTKAAGLRKPGALFVLNAAPSRDLPAELWAAVDLLVVNEHEAADLAGSSEALLDRVPVAVVTRGGDGCLVLRRGQEPLPIKGIPVQVIDTTGAGDTFCGVLAAGLARGLDVEAAARLATAAGALAVTRPGAQTAVPSAEEVAQLGGKAS
jgi:ribokinase